MPLKGQSPKQIVHTEMHKFKHGTLHSGSKQGPKVKSRDQAIAIALSESGQSKKKSESKKGYDRSSHYKGNPGFPSSSEAGGSPPPATFKEHEQRERDTLGASYPLHEKAEQASYLRGQTHSFNPPPATNAHSIGGNHPRDGHLRNSGHSGAHRIGKRK